VVSSRIESVILLKYIVVNEIVSWPPHYLAHQWFSVNLAIDTQRRQMRDSLLVNSRTTNSGLVKSLTGQFARCHGTPHRCNKDCNQLIERSVIQPNHLTPVSRILPSVVVSRRTCTLMIFSCTSTVRLVSMRQRRHWRPRKSAVHCLTRI